MPPDPEQAARYFQPLAVEQQEDAPVPGQARLIRMNRLLRPRSSRRISAFFWVTGRKISRLHRVLPLWLVTVLYLLLAGVLCFVLTKPLLHKPEIAAVRLPERPAPEPTLVEALSSISQRITEKDFVRAREEIQKLEARYPDDSRVLMTKGATFAAERAFPEALAAFQMAHQLAPGSAAAQMNLAEIEFVMAKYPEAEEHYRALLAKQPKNTLVLLRLYLCAQVRKDPQAAATYLRNPALGAQSLEWYYMNAADALFAGNKEEGVKTIEKARLLFGEKTRPYDKTFARLGLIPSPPEN